MNTHHSFHSELFIPSCFGHFWADNPRFTFCFHKCTAAAQPQESMGMLSLSAIWGQRYNPICPDSCQPFSVTRAGGRGWGTWTGPSLFEREPREVAPGISQLLAHIDTLKALRWSAAPSKQIVMGEITWSRKFGVQQGLIFYFILFCFPGSWTGNCL